VQGLFVGSTWYPNVEALHYFAREILPLLRRHVPEFRLVVAGNVSESRELRLPPDSGIELLGFVDDLRPHLAASRVFVVPILRGHGSRLKILDAAAAGVPVVSTTKGAEGLTFLDGSEIILADDPVEFAGSVIRLLRDDAFAKRLGDAAFERVRREYDWSCAGERLEEAFSLLPARRSGRAHAPAIVRSAS
ncbi:MAG: glycosyltransferase family 4 protein, partial [Candidatus Binatia bacterium]